MDAAWTVGAPGAQGSACDSQWLRGGWALKGVSAAQASAGLERAVEQLTRQGWQVAEYGSPASRYEFTDPGAEGDPVRIKAYPRDRLAGSDAPADCAG